MSNDYFVHSVQLVAGTKATAAQVNSRMNAIEDGFDKFPAAHATLKGFSEPVAVADPTAASHAMSAGAVQRGDASYAADTGAANFPIVTLTIAPAGYVDGLTVRFKAAVANTGPVAINVNGLGQKSVVRSDGVDLATGDIVVGQIVTAVYSGTKFYATAMIGAQLAATLSTATTQAGIATTQAGLAATAKSSADADAAATAADRLAMANPLLIGTSITSNYLAPSGYKTFTTQSGKSFSAGQKAMAYYNSDPSGKWMGGVVISYSGTSIVIDMDTCVGSGTYTNWTISATQIAGDVIRAADQAIAAAASALAASQQATAAEASNSEAGGYASLAAGHASDAANSAASIPSLLTSSVTVTVGSGGDYATINEAIAGLCSAYRGPLFNGSSTPTATISLLTGFVMNEQVFVKNVDLSWITITASSTISFLRSALAASFESYRAAFTADNAALPKIDVLFSVDISGGIAMNRGMFYLSGPNASLTLLSGGNGAAVSSDQMYFGVRATKGARVLLDSGGSGLAAIFTGFRENLYAGFMAEIEASSYGVFTGAAGVGVRAEYGGRINVYYSNCQKGASPSEYDIYVYKGGLITAYYATGGLYQTANTITENGIIFQ